MIKKQELFLTDVAHAMANHDVKNVILIYSMDGQLRNTALTDQGDKSEFYHTLSDQLDSFLKFVANKNL